VSKPPPSYSDLAASLGIRRCRGELGVLCYVGHWGLVTSDNVVHWSDRRVTRPGIRYFCRLAAFAQMPPAREKLEPWMREYLIQRRLPALAARAGVRWPKSLDLTDRLRLRAMIPPPRRPGDVRDVAMHWVDSLLADR
jgi:hypothetical protein